MKILLDTQVLLALLRGELAAAFPTVAMCMSGEGTEGFVSVATLWEIAIKTRLGKLAPGMALFQIPAALVASRLTILPVEARHAVDTVQPEPATRDPFDRMLLTQCRVDGLLLATVDRALVFHRLALKP